MTTEEINGLKKPKMQKSRRKSRELALKAGYRGLLNSADFKQVLRDAQEDPDYARADEDFFKLILQGVITHAQEIDQKISTYIDRKLTELSPVEHAILRISAYELLHEISIPYRVTINEGVELAKTFGATDGHKYINGVLDKLAADVRASEFKQAHS